MITITMPEWFTWLLSILLTLQAVNIGLDWYLRYLKRKPEARNG